MLYFAHVFIRGHITIHNHNHLLSLHKIYFKTIKYWHATNIKTETNLIKRISIKNGTCYYSDHIIQIEDFDFLIRIFAFYVRWSRWVN